MTNKIETNLKKKEKHSHEQSKENLSRVYKSFLKSDKVLETCIENKVFAPSPQRPIYGDQVVAYKKK